MGIRFFCPNGHRLHVKAFLAGKRGYCPKCGTKLLIPEESAASLNRNDTAEASQAANLLPKLSEPASGMTPQTAANPTACAASEPGALLQPNPDSAHAEHEPIRSQRPTVDNPTLDARDDPFWYVRPPSGGQYGPATHEEIDRWNGEGRIPAESLVWREGWSEWRTAAESLHAESGTSDPDASFELQTQTDSGGTSLDHRSHQAVAKRKKTATVICLSLACFILMVIFLIVVKPGSG